MRYFARGKLSRSLFAKKILDMATSFQGRIRSFVKRGRILLLNLNELGESHERQ